MTNFERIKNMTVEEMARFISCIDIDEVNSFTYLGDDNVFSKEEELETENDIKEWLREEYKG